MALPCSTRAQEPARRLGIDGEITHFIAPEDPAAGSRPGDRELAEDALAAWTRLLGRATRLTPASQETATVRVYWPRASAGMYGEMRARELNGRLAADVFVHPDTDALGPDIALAARADPLFRDTVVYLTCVHELGHAFGLGHTAAFADIMYSFEYGGDLLAYFRRFRQKLQRREDIPTTSPFSAADAEALRALYR